MEIAHKRLIGGAAGLAVAAIGGGLLLGDFATTDTFAYYKQPHASSYQSPGATGVANTSFTPVASPAVVRSDPAVSPAPRVRRHDEPTVEPEILADQVDGSSDEPGWRESPERDAEGEE